MTSKTILVADDQPHIIELVVVSLDDPEFNIVTAVDGEEAINKAVSVHPDLILLDVLMPKLDGFEVCRRLKKLEATSSVPIILLTSKGQPEDRAMGIACGADAFLSKPFSPIKLLSTVQEYLNLQKRTANSLEEKER